MTARLLFRNVMVILLTAVPVRGADNTCNFENTNFVIQQPDIFNTTHYLYDHNRLRVSDQLVGGPFFMTVTGDWVNYSGERYVKSADFKYRLMKKADIPFDIRTKAHHYGPGATCLKLHRLYAGYEDSRQGITVGIQKISMGVGRIWTPTDIYNPQNSYAVEPDEVFGVLAANYTCSLSDLSSLNAIVSIRRDNSLKYAARIKGCLDSTDAGVNLILSDDTVMAGYEVEGNLWNTGAEWRSEGGYYRNDPLNADFFQGILGADYGFEGGLTAAVEVLYSSETFAYMQIIKNFENEIINNMTLSHFYLGSTLHYDFNLAFSGSLIYIESFTGTSTCFIAPTFTYTMGDHNMFSMSAQFNMGDIEFGNSYFIKWTANF